MVEQTVRHDPEKSVEADATQTETPKREELADEALRAVAGGFAMPWAHVRRRDDDDVPSETFERFIP